MVCKKCSQTISDDVSFCPLCGEKIEKNEQPRPMPASASPFTKAGSLDGSPSRDAGAPISMTSSAPKAEPTVRFSKNFAGENKAPAEFQPYQPIETPPVAPPPPSFEPVAMNPAPIANDSRKCVHCGAELKEGAKFCRECGIKVDEVPVDTNVPIMNIPPIGIDPIEAEPPVYGGDDPLPISEESPVEPNQGAMSGNNPYGAPVTPDPRKSKKKLVILLSSIAAVILIAVAVVLAVFVFGPRSVEETVDQYIKAMVNADAAAALDLMPDQYVDASLDESDMSKNEMLDMIEEEFRDRMDQLEDEYGKFKRYEYKIVDEEDAPDSVVDSINTELEYRDVDMKVTAVKMLEIEATYEFSDGEYTGTIPFHLIKIGNSWYIYTIYTV